MKKILIVLSFICVLYVSHYINEKIKYYETPYMEESNYDFFKISNTSIIFPSFSFPIKEEYRISSDFGIRKQIIKGIGGEEGDFHRGIDIVAVEGSKIIASASGNVHLHYPPPNGFFKGHPVFGGLIVIDHGNNIYSLYGHLSKSYVKENQYIKQGEVIGIVGNTGISTGTHLHFEILINPLGLIDLL